MPGRTVNRRVRKRAVALARLLVFVLLVFVALPAKRHWLRGVLHDNGGVMSYVIDHMIDLAAVLAFSGIVAAIERRPFAAFGLPLRQALGARFWQGAAVGMASLVVLVFGLRLVGALDVRAPATPALEMAGYGIGYAVLLVLLATCEEFLYRGYGLFTLTEATTFWFAAVASTVWFTWTHSGPHENWIGLASVLLFGLLACLTLRRTGNLWLALGFHAAWNWGQTFLFGVSDSGHATVPGHFFTSTVSPSAPVWLSGGPVGPEGSALCAVILVLLWIACAWLPRGIHYPISAGTEATVE